MEAKNESQGTEASSATEQDTDRQESSDEDDRTKKPSYKLNPSFKKAIANRVKYDLFAVYKYMSNESMEDVAREVVERCRIIPEFVEKLVPSFEKRLKWELTRRRCAVKRVLLFKYTGTL